MGPSVVGSHLCGPSGRPLGWLVARPCLVHMLLLAAVSRAWSQGCEILGAPRAIAGSLMGGVRILKTLALVPGLLAGRAGYWSLAAGPRHPRAHFRLLPGKSVGWLLVPDAAGHP